MEKLDNIGYKLIDKHFFNHRFASYVFEVNKDCIIIDYFFEKDSNNIFDYSEYCEMQNKYTFIYDRLFRYNFDGNVSSLIEQIESDLNQEVIDIELSDDGGHFDKSHIDNTPLEHEFEKVFTEVYGSDALYCLQKEVSISNHDSSNVFVDYVVETVNGNYAFEENGVSYHHPCLIGKEAYQKQLQKQNILNLFGFKVYRFSSQNIDFKEQMIEKIKQYIPNKESFIPKSIIKNGRGVVLYEHQTNILKELDKDRLFNNNTSLIVLPTASGKSEIILTDLEKEYIKEKCNRVLIMVPTTKIKADWESRVINLHNNYQIDVMCYNAVFRKKNSITQEYYDYIVVDEAHHSQAANLKSVIQYFNPKYLIGLTATDERIDQKKLSEIFGQYEVKMSLREAIEKEVVTNIRAYRLISNVNLKDVRYNGKDYNYSDLEKTLIVDSKNELIVDTILKYFKPQENFYKQGIIFCVNKKHCAKLAKLLSDSGLKAEAVYGGNKNNDSIFENYKHKRIQFLCSCQLISEGWDCPQTEIIVMARPTLSKVLYLQQLGRGLRKYPGKESLYLIDVVDNYESKLTPWNFNSLFKIPNYSPFMGVVNNHLDYLSIFGLNEMEMKMEEIDIFTFEEKYKDYLSLEQAARELYVGTNTLAKWNRDNKYASLYLPIGSKQVPYFNSNDIDNIRKDKKLKIHGDETILEDFIDFIDENTLTFSFKLVFMLSCFSLADKEGNINLDKLIDKYVSFYKERINKGLPVDKSNCIYTKEYLNDYTKIKRNMLDNPFEKFERKRFVYLSKDLNIIAFNSLLWYKLTEELKQEIINKLHVFLVDYYEEYGGLVHEYKF